MAGPVFIKFFIFVFFFVCFLAPSTLGSQQVGLEAAKSQEVSLQVRRVSGDSSPLAPFHLHFSGSLPHSPLLTLEFEVVVAKHQFFADHAQFSAKTEDGETVQISTLEENHSWLRGTLVGDPDVRVRFTHKKSEGLFFYGTIHHPALGYFILELTETNSSSTPYLMMLRHSSILNYPDLRFASNGHSCSSSSEHRPHPLPGANLNESFLPLNIQRRGGPLGPSYTQCDVFADADAYFFNAWGGGCVPGDSSSACLNRRVERAMVRVLDILHQVDGIYTMSANLSPYGIVVRGIMVHADNKFGLSDPSSSVLITYEKWLAMNSVNGIAAEIRGAGYPTAQDVCLNHFFTHVGANGYLGVASLASPNPGVEGGICSKYIFQNKAENFNYITNAGFSTTKNVPLWQSVLVAAHEIGHNFGASHDCLNDTDCISKRMSGDLCVPSSGGNYIMAYAISGSASLPNNNYFSSCSKSSINAVIEAKGSCMIQSNPCVFGGPCCQGNTLRKKGTVCRAADPLMPCQLAAVCDGSNGFCPPNDYLSNGASCDVTGQGDYATCYKGVCGNLNEEFCRSKLNIPGCTFSGKSCSRACTYQATGSCVMYRVGCGGGSFWNGTIAPCDYAPESTPCQYNSTTDGLCDSSGQCSPCADGGCAPQQIAADCSWQLEASFSSCQCPKGVRVKNYVCVCSSSASSCETFAPEPLTQDCTSACLKEVSLILSNPLLTFNQTLFLSVFRAYIPDMSVANVPEAYVQPQRRAVTSAAPEEVFIIIMSSSLSSAQLSAQVLFNRTAIVNKLGYSFRIFDSSASSSSSPGGSNAGAVAGAVVGVLIAVALIAVGVYFYRRHKSASPSKPEARTASKPVPSKPSADTHTQAPSRPAPPMEKARPQRTAPLPPPARPVQPLSRDPVSVELEAIRPVPKPAKPVSAPLPSKSEGEAIFDFEALDDTQLSLSKGDKVTMASVVGVNGWLLVELKNKSGYVPESYIKITTRTAPKTMVLGGLGGESGTDDSMEPEVPDVKAVPLEKNGKKMATPTADKFVQYKALYAYQASSSDELTFEQGDLIDLTTTLTSMQGWWRGRVHGSTVEALFPSDYVEAVPALTSQLSVLTSNTSTYKPSVKPSPGHQPLAPPRNPRPAVPPSRPNPHTVSNVTNPTPTSSSSSLPPRPVAPPKPSVSSGPKPAVLPRPKMV